MSDSVKVDMERVNKLWSLSMQGQAASVDDTYWLTKQIRDLVPHPDPAEERLEGDSCEDCARGRCPEHGSLCTGATCCCADKHREYASPHSAKSCLPQTPGEEMPAFPEWLQKRIAEAQGVQLPDGKSMAIIALAESHSRLLTALDEKEQANRKLRTAVISATNNYMRATEEVEALQSAVVLQKEEIARLEKQVDLVLENSIVWQRKYEATAEGQADGC